MKLSSYFVLSLAAAVVNCLHAWGVHEQFYPAVIHLASDKVSLAVLYNFVFSCFLMFGYATLKFFVGRLRDLEVEQLIDSGRGFVADTILFLVFYSPTIDQKEVATLALMQFIVGIIFLKMFHLISQIRVGHMFEIGAPKRSVKIKLAVMMGMLLLTDLVILDRFYGAAGKHSTFYTWILFEACSMAAMLSVTGLKYVLHLIDTSLEHGWPGKAAYIFYLELLGDVVSMVIFLCFMSIFFIQNPSRLPIYMMADIIQVARQLTTRLRNFRKYRLIMADFETKFREASKKELEAAETCIICRDDLDEGSVILPCNHIFHVDCLKSWLVMQQVCPTCRSEIPIEREKLNAAYRESDIKAGRPIRPENNATPIEQEKDAKDAPIPTPTYNSVNATDAAAGGAPERTPSAAPTPQASSKKVETPSVNTKSDTLQLPPAAPAPSSPGKSRRTTPSAAADTSSRSQKKSFAGSSKKAAKKADPTDGSESTLRRRRGSSQSGDPPPAPQVIESPFGATLRDQIAREAYPGTEGASSSSSSATPVQQGGVLSPTSKGQASSTSSSSSFSKTQRSRPPALATSTMPGKGAEQANAGLSPSSSPGNLPFAGASSSSRSPPFAFSSGNPLLGNAPPTTSAAPLSPTSANKTQSGDTPTSFADFASRLSMLPGGSLLLGGAMMQEQHVHHQRRMEQLNCALEQANQAATQLANMQAFWLRQMQVQQTTLQIQSLQKLLVTTSGVPVDAPVASIPVTTAGVQATTTSAAEPVSTSGGTTGAAGHGQGPVDLAKSMANGSPPLTTTTSQHPIMACPLEGIASTAASPGDLVAAGTAASSASKQITAGKTSSLNGNGAVTEIKQGQAQAVDDNRSELLVTLGAFQDLVQTLQTFQGGEQKTASAAIAGAPHSSSAAAVASEGKENVAPPKLHIPTPAGGSAVLSSCGATSSIKPVLSSSSSTAAQQPGTTTSEIGALPDDSAASTSKKQQAQIRPTKIADPGQQSGGDKRKADAVAGGGQVGVVEESGALLPGGAAMSAMSKSSSASSFASPTEEASLESAASPTEDDGAKGALAELRKLQEQKFRKSREQSTTSLATATKD
ncbi:unnamed protein product [Amoebophrya sp. A25]|nr:unnamed protein product [Amoebophrya sp. A25]|eukprot:GSA25T00016594001.1